MKSSKYTQARTPNDNDYRDYQNVGVTLLPDESNQNLGGQRSSDFLLKGAYDPFRPPDRFSPERNANRFPVDIELCSCAKEAAFKGPHMVMNRSFSTLPKFDTTNLSQFSLDRKLAKFPPRHHQKHGFQCEVQRRVQSPEIINIHRGPSSLYEYGDGNNCAVKSCAYDKEFKCDDYGFRRGHPFRTSSR